MNVPEELKHLIDRAAGKEHSADGAVMTTLAAVLDRHEAMVIEKLLDWTRDMPDGSIYLARLSCGHAKPLVNNWPPGDSTVTYCPACREQVGALREITRDDSR